MSLDKSKKKIIVRTLICVKCYRVYYYHLTSNTWDCSYRRYWLLATKNELANNSCLGSTVNCSSGSTGRMSFSGRSFFSNMSFGKRKPFLNIRLVTYICYKIKEKYLFASLAGHEIDFGRNLFVMR